MWISSAKAGPKGTTGGAEVPPKAVPPAEVPAKISDAFDVVKPADGFTWAGYFTHIGTINGTPNIAWIRVDENIADAVVDYGDGNAEMTDSVTYRGNFRWTIMAADGKTPLAIETLNTQAEDTVAVGSGPAGVLLEAAHAKAITLAANTAARWLDRNFGGAAALA
jgi:hypothetical protein